MVLIPRKDIEKLSRKTLAQINDSLAVVTVQSEDFDVNKFFRTLFKKFKDDFEKKQHKRKLSNLLQTIIFFVSEEDFTRCQEPFEVTFTKSTQGTAVDRLFADLKEWGGLDKEKVLQSSKKENLESIPALISSLEENLKAQQQIEEKQKDDLKLAEKNNDQQALKRIQLAQEEAKEKREIKVKENEKMVSALSQA